MGASDLLEGGHLTLTLTCPGADAPEGTVHWDPESGVLEGDLAPKVEALIENAEACGYVTTHPYPSTYEVDDPRHKYRDMGLVLSERWVVPGSLEPYLPDPPPEPETDLPLLY